MKIGKTFSFIFLVILASLGLWTIFSEQVAFSNLERRPLAKVSNVNIAEGFDGSFQKEFQTAVADQVPARDFWLGLKAQMQAWMGKADNGRVYLADEHFLIEKNGALDEKNLKQAVGDMRYFAEEFFEAKSPHGKKEIILAPTQASIYSRLLPKGHLESEQASILEKLVQENLGETLDYVDVYQTLEDANALLNLYFKTDHHWTQDGALLAYKAWLESRDLTFEEGLYEKTQVSDAFFGTTYAKAPLLYTPSDEIIAYSTSDMAEVQLIAQDKLLRKGIYNPEALSSYDPYEYFVGKNIDHLTLNTSFKNGEHLLMFKDSYANAFVPFLTRHYESITMIDLRYYAGDMANLLAENDFTDVLFLYNIVTLSQDTSTYKLLQ